MIDYETIYNNYHYYCRTPETKHKKRSWENKDQGLKANLDRVWNNKINSLVYFIKFNVISKIINKIPPREVIKE